MTAPHTQIEIPEDAVPQCDLDSRHGNAYADAAIPAFGGSWANVCHECFTSLGCSLGLGRGQQYIKVVVL